MDMKVVSSKSIMAAVAALMTLIAVMTGKANAMSIPGTKSSTSGSCLTPLSVSSLYPTTTTLALHPMTETPYEGGSSTPASPCPESGVATVTDDDLINRKSTCPHEYFTNFDQLRIPASIPEARCLCGGCLDPYSGVQRQDLTCQEIKYPMKVLRKSTTSPINSFEMYTLTEEPITIGCACSRLV